MQEDDILLPRSQSLWGFCWFWAVILALWAVFAPILTHQYMVFFEEAGMDLPAPTLFFIHMRYGWGVLLIPVFALSISVSRHPQYSARRRMFYRMALGLLLVIPIGLIIVWAIAMLAPPPPFGVVV